MLPCFNMKDFGQEESTITMKEVRDLYCSYISDNRFVS